MFHTSRFRREALTLIITAAFISLGILPASALPADGTYDCNTGIASAVSPKFTITSGEISNGNSCSGEVVIPNGALAIGDGAFWGSTLTSITIPNTVTAIGESALRATYSLTSITIPNSVTIIGDYAFRNTHALRSVIIPNSVTRIGDYAFSGTTSLVAVTIPDLVTNIGDYVFYDATSLTSLTIPSTVTSIGSFAFTGTNSLSTYTYCGTASVVGTGLETKTRISVCATAPSPLFTFGSSNESGYSVQIANYDPTFTYSVTSSAGSVSISSTGLITVSGLSPDQTATVTVTTSRDGYATNSSSVSGRAGVLPMLPTNKPTVTVSDNLITCTIGTYSAAPTSSAFSLFVDGKHISTNFSALGEYLPDWIIPWASTSTITRTATLSTATWPLLDAYKGKAITCATLGYSKYAIGFTASQVLVAR